MAKKSGANNASKVNERVNAKLGEIRSAAKSTMEPADYSKGYPEQPTAIYPGNISMTRGKPGGK